MTATLNGRNGHARLPRGTVLDASGEPMTLRMPINPMAQQSAYGSGTGYGQYGASTSKNSLLGWVYNGGDADRDIGSNVQVLRERSRDAFMGIPLAAGAIETLVTNVVGEGIFPQPNVDGEALGLSETQTTDLNKELAERFDWWACDPRECDLEAMHTFYTKESVVYQSALLSGDCPVLFPLKPRPGTLFDFRLRVLEADRVMNPMFANGSKNIYCGVELKDDGELAAFHVAKSHPLSTTNYIRGALMKGETIRIEPFGAQSGRRNMVLVGRPERPEQRRGVPILSVCLELLKQIGRFTDSTVIAAVIQSYFTAFVTSEFPDPQLFESLLTDEQKAEILNLNPYNVQLGPGIVNFMRPGAKIEFGNPNQPQATFGEFTVAVAKFVGSAVGVPYEVLLKQFNSSYSASRAALLDFWKRVRKHRALMIDGFCQPSYEEWMSDAIGLGRIERFPGGWDDPYVRRAMTKCNWAGSSAGSIDPDKEVTAADKRVKGGFSTIERETIELNGSDYRDNIRQQGVEQTEFREADLVFPPYRPTQLAGDAPALAGSPAPSSTPTPGAPPTRAKARVRTRLRTAVELASGTSGVFHR